jgi:hypothetical protein
VRRALRHFRERFVSELPLWRLGTGQLVLLSLWATWPWLVNAVVPAHDLLAFAPMIPMLPFGYLGGSAAVALAPDFPPAYAIGFSMTAFALGYVVLVSWRHARERKQ